MAVACASVVGGFCKGLSDPHWVAGKVASQPGHRKPDCDCQLWCCLLARCCCFAYEGRTFLQGVEAAPNLLPQQTGRSSFVGRGCGHIQQLRGRAQGSPVGTGLRKQCCSSCVCSCHRTAVFRVRTACATAQQGLCVYCCPQCCSVDSSRWPLRPQLLLGVCVFHPGGVGSSCCCGVAGLVCVCWVVPEHVCTSSEDPIQGGAGHSCCPLHMGGQCRLCLRRLTVMRFRLGLAVLGGQSACNWLAAAPPRPAAASAGGVGYMQHRAGVSGCSAGHGAVRSV